MEYPRTVGLGEFELSARVTGRTICESGALGRRNAGARVHLRWIERRAVRAGAIHFGQSSRRLQTKDQLRESGRAEECRALHDLERDRQVVAGAPLNMDTLRN